MKRIAKKLIGSFRNVDYNYLYSQGVAFDDISFKGETKYVNLKSLHLEIPYEANHFLIKGYHQAQKLQSVVGAKFSVVNNEVFVDIKDIKLNLQTEEELFILSEIYIEGVYNFFCSPCIVIDIGMNVAFSSLFFASNAQVQTVYSYEPFEETFKQGLKNISLNPNYSNKITPFNFGLGGTDKMLDVNYCPDWKGAMSMYGISDESAKQRNILQTTKHKILIKSITKEIENFKGGNNIKKIAKIDCEGAEYEILDALKEADLLSYFDVFMIEWHLLGASDLIHTLSENGFVIFSPQPTQTKVGMVYAFK